MGSPIKSDYPFFAHHGGNIEKKLFRACWKSILFQKIGFTISIMPHCSQSIILSNHRTKDTSSNLQQCFKYTAEQIRRKKRSLRILSRFITRNTSEMTHADVSANFAIIRSSPYRRFEWPKRPSISTLSISSCRLNNFWRFISMPFSARTFCGRPNAGPDKRILWFLHHLLFSRDR